MQQLELNSRNCVELNTKFLLKSAKKLDSLFTPYFDVSNSIDDSLHVTKVRSSVEPAIYLII